MRLIGVAKENDWLFSEWRLTYRVGWGQILSAGMLIFHYTEDPEIMIGDAGESRVVAVRDEKDILSLKESGFLTNRGMSEMIRFPLMITFYNQLDLVRASVACATEEFMEADYKNFNLSMCQFMDSAELAMYR